MLELIHSPQDLKTLSYAQKADLAQEIRKTIIDTVSKNGGHLASNLGSVEMTIAMHCVFHAPKDKIIFDVGHQSYTHKLLTGRYGLFSGLRCMDGISGFTRIKESEYDTVCSGHASDSISLAVGFARARDLLCEDHCVVSVLGDGALTGGMCYEALNDAGQSKERIIILLNDNEMSISKNVGALSTHLTHLRQSKFYRSLKQKVRRIINVLPNGGTRTERFISKIKDSLKTLLVSDTFFDSLDIEYLGPINGHDIKEMERVFENAKNYDKPVVIHCITEKGRGYEPARTQPNRFHGVSSFDKITGSLPASSVKSCGKLACEWLIGKAQTNPGITCISAAMLSGTGMESFASAFPKRCFDVGIAEEHAITMACGQALGGLRPYVAIYSTFLQRAFDQLLMDMSLNQAPVTFLIDRFGLTGADGETHQGIFTNSLLKTIPGMLIAIPANTSELLCMLEQSIDTPSFMAICYSKYLPSSDVSCSFRIGNWGTIREGKETCIISYGMLLQQLSDLCRNIYPEFTLINARYIKPMDSELLDHIKKTHRRIFVFEECVQSGSLSEAVAEYYANDSEIKVHGKYIENGFVAAGTIEQQRKICGLSNESFIEFINRCIQNET